MIAQTHAFATRSGLIRQAIAAHLTWIEQMLGVSLTETVIIDGIPDLSQTGVQKLLGVRNPRRAGWKGGYVNSACDTVQNSCSNYAYDEFGRLGSSTVYQGSGLSFTYVYDRWGNRWQQSGGSPSPNLSFNTSTNQITNGGFTYDAAGNMTADGTHSYSYDAEGNLVQVDGGSTAAYTYDALNHRIRTQNTGQDNYEYIFNPEGQRAAIWDATYGWELEGNSYWNGRPIEFYDAGIAQFQHQDWIGTERMVTDNNGNPEGTYTSVAFGDGLTISGADNDAYHFAGLDYDFSSATDHAQFRQYYPAAGNWVSPDLFTGSYDFSNPQSLNRYSYVMNNPLSSTDPTGQMTCPGCAAPISFACPWCGAVAAGVGLVYDLGKVFCWWGCRPSFHGSLKPRPNAQPWDEYHIQYGSNIAGALGLPDAGCEFGACGSGTMGFTNSGALDVSSLSQFAALFAAKNPWLPPNVSGRAQANPPGNATPASIPRQPVTPDKGPIEIEQSGPNKLNPTEYWMYILMQMLRIMDNYKGSLPPMVIDQCQLYRNCG